MSHSPPGVNVPEGSAELEAIFTDFFDSNDQPHVGTEFSGRSDYQAFIDNGVPASGLFSGADAIKTAEEVELFGGTEGVQQDRNYHTIDDTIENVSTESIDIFSTGDRVRRALRGLRPRRRQPPPMIRRTIRRVSRLMTRPASPRMTRRVSPRMTRAISRRTSRRTIRRISHRTTWRSRSHRRRWGSPTSWTQTRASTCR